MPVYSAKASSLETVGPIIDIQLTLSSAAAAAVQAANQSMPSPLTVAALIDTGASKTVIQAGLPAKLGLKPVGVQLVNTPTSHRVECLRYLVRLIFPSTAGIRVPISFETVVIEAPLQGQNIQALIGRDFLKDAVLFYSGPDNMFTISL